MRLHFVTPPLLALATLGCGSTADSGQSSTQTTSTFVTSPQAPSSTVGLDPAADQVVGSWRFSAIEGPDGASLADNLTEGSIVFDVTGELGLSVNLQSGSCSEFAGGIESNAGRLRITTEYEQTLEECAPASGPVPAVGAALSCLRAGCGYEVVDGQLRFDLGDGQILVLT